MNFILALFASIVLVIQYRLDYFVKKTKDKRCWAKVILILGVLIILISAAAIEFTKCKEEKYQSEQRKQTDKLLKIECLKINDIRANLVYDMYFIAVSQNNGKVEWPASENSNLKNHFPKEKQVFDVCNNISLKRLNFKEENWIDRLYRIKLQVQPICENILLLDKNLEPKEIRLIYRLLNSDLLSKVELYKQQQDSGIIIQNENLSFLCSEIQDFLLLSERVYIEMNKEN